MREYVPLAQRHLEEHPTCQFPLGCDRPATCVHHKRGRFGRRLIDPRYLASSCDEHNQYAEDHTGHSLEIGWLIPIEGTHP